MRGQLETAIDELDAATRTTDLDTKHKIGLIYLRLAAEITSCDAETLVHILSEPGAHDDGTGKVLFCVLAKALCKTAAKNDTADVVVISKLLCWIVRKCDTEKLIAQLLKGLSERVMRGELSGDTGFHALAGALCQATHHNNAVSVAAINELLLEIAQTCSTPQLQIRFARGLFESECGGVTGFDQLIGVCKMLGDNQDAQKEHIGQFIVQLIVMCGSSALPPAVKSIIIGAKTYLKEAIEKYLTGLSNLRLFAKQVAPNTLLGQIIDSKWMPGKSDMRVFVEALYERKLQEEAARLAVKKEPELPTLSLDAAQPACSGPVQPASSGPTWDAHGLPIARQVELSEWTSVVLATVVVPPTHTPGVISQASLFTGSLQTVAAQPQNIATTTSTHAEKMPCPA